MKNNEKIKTIKNLMWENGNNTILCKKGDIKAVCAILGFKFDECEKFNEEYNHIYITQLGCCTLSNNSQEESKDILTSTELLDMVTEEELNIALKKYDEEVDEYTTNDILDYLKDEIQKSNSVEDICDVLGFDSDYYYDVARHKISELKENDEEHKTMLNPDAE